MGTDFGGHPSHPAGPGDQHPAPADRGGGQWYCSGSVSPERHVQYDIWYQPGESVRLCMTALATSHATSYFDTAQRSHCCTAVFRHSGELSRPEILNVTPALTEQAAYHEEHAGQSAWLSASVLLCLVKHCFFPRQSLCCLCTVCDHRHMPLTLLYSKVLLPSLTTV